MAPLPFLTLAISLTLLWTSHSAAANEPDLSRTRGGSSRRDGPLLLRRQPMEHWTTEHDVEANRQADPPVTQHIAEPPKQQTSLAVETDHEAFASAREPHHASGSKKIMLQPEDAGWSLELLQGKPSEHDEAVHADAIRTPLAWRREHPEKAEVLKKWQALHKIPDDDLDELERIQADYVEHWRRHNEIIGPPPPDLTWCESFDPRVMFGHQQSEAESQKKEQDMRAAMAKNWKEYHEIDGRHRHALKIKPAVTLHQLQVDDTHRDPQAPARPSNTTRTWYVAEQWWFYFSRALGRLARPCEHARFKRRGAVTRTNLGRFSPSEQALAKVL